MSNFAVRFGFSLRCILQLGVLLGAFWDARVHGAGTIDFRRDVRPILSEACFRCHGFDAAARQAGMRLDVPTEAFKPARSGGRPIVPGRPSESEVLRRIQSTDPDVMMPPPSSQRVLTAVQRETLRQWILEGAVYRGHWAFEAPVRPEVPPAETFGGSWSASNPIDRFVGATLRQRGWTPAPEADRATLLRRVTLDLTGLPPTPAEFEAYQSDVQPGAFERVVDRLLQSPRYGERRAQDWLDAARHADSNGYQVDRDRELWAWRDWVVRAFNRNLPFDQFTLEQIAGDLLPGATLEQRIATGFHRNHMINEEGGIIPEEFLNEYCADRVETTATVWLGQTFNCARCHDHKYDPFTQRDFYGLYAFFHNVTEKGVGDYGAPYRRSSPPFLKLPTPALETRLAGLKESLTTELTWLTNATTKVRQESAAWEERARMAQANWTSPTVIALDAGSAGVLTNRDDGWWVQPTGVVTGSVVRVQARWALARVTALRLEIFDAAETPANATNRLALREWRIARGAEKSIAPRSRLVPGGAPVEEVQRVLDGKLESTWQPAATSTNPAVAVVDFLPALENGDPTEWRMQLDWAGVEANPRWRFRLLATELPLDLLLTPDAQALVAKNGESSSEEEKKRLEEFRLAQVPGLAEHRRRVTELNQQSNDLENVWPVTLVMEELPQPRETFILKRGAYDKQGEPVSAATPASLPGWNEAWPRNRLGLARWLVDPANPLVARVTINRFWQSFFGTGLVRTAEDFGVQGEAPTHPDLLDWLATEFIRRGWDIRGMVRLIVTSATYRQDSRVRPESRGLDPENRWLARGPRHRLSAEEIRDQALAVSGLLCGELGGPPVRPYHPPGLYEQVVAGSSADSYVADHGIGLYRRTLYTYWKRSVPNPALLLFDRPFRETCAVRRPRTSTPLQALNLLNDPTYVEAARALAQRVLREGGASTEARLRWGFRRLLVREPRPTELAVLLGGWQRALAGFRAEPARALELLKVGESAYDPTLDPVELAAGTTVMSTLLNLDEAITKE